MDANTKIELLSEKNKDRIKKHPFITGFVVLIVIIFFINLFNGGSSNSTTPPPQQTQQQTSTPTVSKEQAQKELNDFMETAKKAKLVSSYEFSDKATVVYIDSMWYTQKVDFKKDFIAKIGLLKKAVTGYSHFEAKDAYSNEKVAEITSFSQSIEIYK
ncbi:MAG: hypothetical protein WA101_02345 [Minisyncoccia bacterium]